jgi:hypothetical protein
LKWGTVGEREKRMPGPEWMGIAPHTKEGFQVSKRDSGTGGGFFRQRGIVKGDRQGVIKGIVPCTPI